MTYLRLLLVSLSWLASTFYAQSPVANFTASPLTVCVGQNVSFTNTSSANGGPALSSYQWDFGDGTTSTNENPAHIYHLPGVYTVTLISFSAEGCSDTLVKLDYVTVPGTYSEFTMANAVNCFNTAVQFVDLSIGATNWFWNFGDGFTSTMQNPTHTYQDSGSYTVTLITSNSTGCSATPKSWLPISTISRARPPTALVMVPRPAAKPPRPQARGSGPSSSCRRTP